MRRDSVPRSKVDMIGRQGLFGSSQTDTYRSSSKTHDHLPQNNPHSCSGLVELILEMGNQGLALVVDSLSVTYLISNILAENGWPNIMLPDVNTGQVSKGVGNNCLGNWAGDRSG